MPIFGIVAAGGLISRLFESVISSGIVRPIRALFSTSNPKVVTIGEDLSFDTALDGVTAFNDVEFVPADYNTFGTDVYLASGNGGKLYKATPTTEWEKVDVDFDSSDNVKVGYVYKNLNGVSWTTQTSNFGTTHILFIAYGDNLWVAGGQGGQLRTSTNAITWVTQNSNFGNTQINSIAYGDNLWVAGGHFGELRTSTNAINWVTRTSNFGNTIINSIAYGNNLWVVGGDRGQLRTSKHIPINGINPTFSDYSNNLFSSTDGFVYEEDRGMVDQLSVNTPDQFTAVSKSLKDNSIILQGTNGVYWSDGTKTTPDPLRPGAFTYTWTTLSLPISPNDITDFDHY
jgi:hypothetical protein